MGRTLKLKNVIYFPDFNKCGGVETFCYEMGLKFGKDYDITVLYRVGDADTIAKIRSTVARVIRFRETDRIECDVFMFGYDKTVLDHVEAKQCIQMFHSDFWARRIRIGDCKQANRLISVSESVAENARKYYRGEREVEVVYNPYTPKKPKKVLNLISATRLTSEKGLERMKILAQKLDEAGIPFHWDVYTDVPRESFNKSVAIMLHRLDVLDFVAKADYLVQLSDSEAYSYSTVEALTVGTPVIVTDLPVLHEIGVVDGKNGFILPLDMSDVPVDRIYKGVKRFEYTPPESHYETVLVKGKAEYGENLGEDVIVRVTRTYHDLQLNKLVHPNEKYIVTRERGEHLEDKGFAVIEDDKDGKHSAT